MATLLAGALGVGAHYLASASGKVVEPILLALFVFLQGYISFLLPFLTYLTYHFYHHFTKKKKKELVTKFIAKQFYLT